MPKLNFIKIICVLGDCKRGKYEVVQNHEAQANFPYVAQLHTKFF